MKFSELSKLSLLILAVFALNSCGSKPDTISPVIIGATVNNIPSGTPLNVVPGDDLNVKASLTDNEGLKSYAIEVHSNFDSHNEKTNATVFSFSESFELLNASANITQVITIDTSAAAGPYHLVLNTIDMGGNSSANELFEINVARAGQPFVTVTTPNPGATLTVSGGDTIQIAGTVTDDTDLESVYIEIGTDRLNLVGYVDEDIYNETFTMTGTNDVSFDLTEVANQAKHIIIPVTARKATWDLKVIATDNENNATQQEIIIVVQ